MDRIDTINRFCIFILAERIDSDGEEWAKEQGMDPYSPRIFLVSRYSLLEETLTVDMRIPSLMKSNIEENNPVALKVQDESILTQIANLLEYRFCAIVKMGTEPLSGSNGELCRHRPVQNRCVANTYDVIYYAVNHHIINGREEREIKFMPFDNSDITIIDLSSTTETIYTYNITLANKFSTF